MDTWEQFLENYKKSSLQTRAFVDSDKIPTIAKNFSGGDLSTQDIVILLSDYVLDVITEDILKKELGIDESGFLKLKTVLEIDDKNTLNPQGLPEANMETKERLELRPEGVERTSLQPVENSNAGEVPQPLTREDVMEALASRRTMESDIESVKQSKNSQTL